MHFEQKSYNSLHRISLPNWGYTENEHAITDWKRLQKIAKTLQKLLLPSWETEDARASLQSVQASTSTYTFGYKAENHSMVSTHHSSQLWKEALELLRKSANHNHLSPRVDIRATRKQPPTYFPPKYRKPKKNPTVDSLKLSAAFLHFNSSNAL